MHPRSEEPFYFRRLRRRGRREAPGGEKGGWPGRPRCNTSVRKHMPELRRPGAAAVARVAPSVLVAVGTHRHHCRSPGIVPTSCCVRCRTVAPCLRWCDARLYVRPLGHMGMRTRHGLMHPHWPSCFVLLPRPPFLSPPPPPPPSLLGRRFISLCGGVGCLCCYSSTLEMSRAGFAAELPGHTQGVQTTTTTTKAATTTMQTDNVFGAN